ncbi:MAG TPA: cupin domain-containing protein [Pararobbsia sp.]|nr:cupin domain-containing protein [Pararobbsia sp.]
MNAPSSFPTVFETAAPSYVFLGVRMRVLLTAQQTNGQFTLIEGSMPPGGDGGLHVHDREDETMTILEGELEVTIGDDVRILKAGASYFAPRGVPQRLRNRGEVPMRGVLVTTPGGFDTFVAKAGLPADAPMPAMPPTQEQIAQLVRLANEHGIRILEAPEF